MSVLGAYTKEKAIRVNGYLAWHGDEEKESKFVTSEKRRSEFDFYIKHANKTGGPILELCSGACRVMAPLAQMGFAVYGLEASRPMIDLGLDKVIPRLSSEERKKIHIVQGDMYNFAFNRQFPLIIIPFCTFWYNCRNAVKAVHDNSVEDETLYLEMARLGEQCLVCIIRALNPGGLFIIDSARSGDWLLSPPGLQDWWERMSEKYNFDYEYKHYDDSISGPGHVIVGRKK